MKPSDEAFTSDSSFLASITALRHDLHRYPEVGYNEHRTASVVADHLRSCHGIEVKTGLGGTGVIGIIRATAPGATIALRADMDALPIREVTGLPYASQHEGVMHACGHDGHTAALLGAATILSAQRHQLKGTVVLVFQPAEEALGGARALLKSGAFDGLDISAMFGLHSWPGRPLGEVICPDGPFMAASDSFSIEVKGLATHAATPHLGADPVLAAAQLVIALQGIRTRCVDPTAPVLISIGSIQGGSVGNIVPNSVRMNGTLRSFDESLRSELKSRIELAATTVPQTLGCTGSITWTNGSSAVINEPNCAASIRRVAPKIPGATLTPNVAAKDQSRPVLVAEDFGEYLRIIPGAFVHIGAGEAAPSLHSNTFDFNDALLPIAIEMHLRIVEEMLGGAGADF